MRACPISDIHLSPNRQRREFPQAELNSLAEDICKPHGLLHAIGVREEAGSLMLVHGERRLRAIQNIYELGGQFCYDGTLVSSGLVPYSTLGDLNEIEREEAELAENIHRADLTWPERIAATGRLARLRGKQAEAGGLPPPSVADIAVEVRGSSLGSYQETTRRELLVERHLDDPEVRAAKSVDEAFKLLKRKEQAADNRARAESVGRSFTAASHTALNEDALAWLATAPAEQFDVILTDPPFGVGADEFADSGGIGGIQGGHTYTDNADNLMDIVSVCRTELFRIAKPQAHLYWFCDIEYFETLKVGFALAGWQVFRTPLIYHKPNAARAPWPDGGPQRQYDLILYARKGKKPVNMLRGDVLTYRPDPQLDHPAQKPVNLFMDLLSRSVRPGDSVLDPFAGTGTLVPAAHELKCYATVIEQDPTSYGTILKRIEALEAQKELAL